MNTRKITLALSLLSGLSVFAHAHKTFIAAEAGMAADLEVPGVGIHLGAYHTEKLAYNVGLVTFDSISGELYPLIGLRYDLSLPANFTLTPMVAYVPFNGYAAQANLYYSINDHWHAYASGGLGGNQSDGGLKAMLGVEYRFNPH